MKKLLVVLLSCIGVLFCMNVNSYTQNDVVSICEFIMSDKSNEIIVNEEVNEETKHGFRTLFSEENLTGHDHFKYRWDVHYVCYEYNINMKNKGIITFTIKEYQSFISPDSRGYVLWRLSDFDRNGVVDSYSRDYFIVGPDNIHILPQYPDGFINSDFHKPSLEESQKRFDREIEYWMDIKRK